MVTDTRVQPRDLPKILLVMAAIGVCVFVVYGAQPSAPPERLNELAERLHRVLEDRVAHVLEWEHAQHAELREVARDERLRRDVEAALGGASIALDGRLDRACLRFAGCAVYDTAGHRLGAFRVREAPHGLVPAALAGQTSTSHVVATDTVGALHPQLGALEVQLVTAQQVQLPVADGGPVEQLQDGPVAKAQRELYVGSLEQRAHLALGKGRRRSRLGKPGERQLGGQHPHPGRLLGQAA